MAITAFTAFLPEVLPRVNGCSEILAVNAVRNSAIEFCSNSLYWQETQDPVDIDETVTPDAPYDMDAPPGARVIQPLSITIDGAKLEPVSLDYLDNNIVNWRASSGRPTMYYQPNPDQLVFVPAPDKTYTVVMRMAYCPLRTATGIESWVYQNYLEALAHGALARLAAMPGQPFTNPELAAFSRTMFNNAMTDATIEANKSFNRGSPTIQLRAVR